MPTLNSSETLTIRGNLDVSSGTLTTRTGQFSRNVIVQEDSVVYGIPLTSCTTVTASGLLPATADGVNLGRFNGSSGYGTDPITLLSSDADGTTVTEKARFSFVIPAEYPAGETLKIRIVGGMNTTVSNSTATVDLSAYLGTATAGVGSDLVTTSAISINSALLATTATTCDFTVSSGSLVPGDELDLMLTVAITDSGSGTAVKGQISKLQALVDIRG